MNFPKLNITGNERLIGNAPQYDPSTGFYTYGTIEGNGGVNVEDTATVRCMIHYDVMKMGTGMVNAVLREAGFDFNITANPIVKCDHNDDHQSEFFQSQEWDD
jgi:hypothetical protein